MSSNKVDAPIAAVPTCQFLTFWPFGPAMNFRNLILRACCEHSPDEILEPSPFLTLIAALPTDAF